MLETVLYPLIGGIVIAFSTSTMLGGLGRMAGISGILGGSLAKINKEDIWRYLFLVGLLVGALFMYLFFPSFFNYEFSFSTPKIVIAGLLVGFGTRLGNGCTSGHGVCGMPRLSNRSIVATCTFIFFGILTVAIERLI